MRLLQIGYSLLLEFIFRVTGVKAQRLRPLDFTPFSRALEALSETRLREIDQLVSTATIAELQRHMENGRLTSELLTLYFIARIRQVEPQLSSLIELNPEVLNEAKQADHKRRSGATLGVMHGIPLTLKDNIEVSGTMHTTAGAMALAENISLHDAPLVTALREAGAVILGKANLSELAGAVSRTPGVSAVGGQTVNPHGKSFSPGGSSSGSCVAVSAGLCVVSVGTETSGSLIAPASFNSVVAMKPSRGLVSGDGVIPLIRFQDSAGPVARCVQDVAALLSVIGTRSIDYTHDLSPDALKNISVGVLRKDILAQKTPLEDTSDNDLVLARIASGLTQAGAVVTDVELSTTTKPKYQTSMLQTIFGGLAHDTMSYMSSVGAEVKSLAELYAFNLARPRQRMPRGQFFLSLALLLAPDYQNYEKNALDARHETTAILNETFITSNVNVLVSISNCHSPLYATAGFPAVTVPLGLRASGMPVGVTFIGRQDEDANLLAYAYAFEQVTKLRVTPVFRER
jgi:amidase